MMKKEIISKNKSGGNTILILVDCLSGALKAGRFALNHLYEEGQTEVVLLQAYNVQGFGLFKMRNLAQVLEDTAMQDLSLIKNKLVEEFDVDADHIQKLVTESSLTTTLKSYFNKKKGLTVIIGDSQESLKSKVPHNQISTIMKAVDVNKVFYVNSDVVVFSHSEVTIISSKQDETKKLPKKIFDKIFGKKKVDVKYVIAKGKKNNEGLKKVDDDEDVNMFNAVEKALEDDLTNSYFENSVNISSY